MTAKKKTTSSLTKKAAAGMGSTPDEQWLIRLALNKIGHLKLSSDHCSIYYFEPMEFQSFVYQMGQHVALVSKMNPEKLAKLIILGLGKDEVTLWRSTSPATFFKTGALTFAWTGAQARFKLDIMAWTVLVAAMYDILATERMIRIRMGTEVETVSYRVPPALLTFVGRERMKLSVADQLRYCFVNLYPAPE